jgi:fructose-bisphosphate aldolase class II
LRKVVVDTHAPAGAHDFAAAADRADPLYRVRHWGKPQRSASPGRSAPAVTLCSAGCLPPKAERTGPMPIATPEVYAEMLDRAKANEFAYPAINVTSSETVNAAIRGFAEAESDGIIQFSTGGAEFASGQKVKDMVTGATALAEFAQVVAAKYDVNVALHTDHCPKNKLDGFVRPLIEISAERVRNGRLPLFQSHMWDGSAIDLDENLHIAQDLLAKTAAAHIILEVEIGVVGGEEDGVEADINEKLYTAEGDFLATIDALGSGENGRYLLAATFGNVHGVYKPGNVKLRPDVLKGGQEAASKKLGLPAGSKPFELVFHGGSGSLPEEIREAVSYGVVKMNVDTDTQYAFTRPIVDHFFTNYDGVLKIDGEVGNKKVYDPRSYLKAAETGMAARIVEACQALGSAGTKLK